MFDPYNIDPNQPRDPKRHVKALKLYGMTIVVILFLFLLMNLLGKILF